MTDDKILAGDDPDQFRKKQDKEKEEKIKGEKPTGDQTSLKTEEKKLSELTSKSYILISLVVLIFVIAMARFVMPPIIVRHSLIGKDAACMLGDFLAGLAAAIVYFSFFRETVGNRRFITVCLVIILFLILDFTRWSNNPINHDRPVFPITWEFKEKSEEKITNKFHKDTMLYIEVQTDTETGYVWWKFSTGKYKLTKGKHPVEIKAGENLIILNNPDGEVTKVIVNPV